jgi:hypothetical protein
MLSLTEMLRGIPQYPNTSIKLVYNYNHCPDRGGDGVKFIVSLNAFLHVQCTEAGVEGLNRVTALSSAPFLNYSCQSPFIILFQALSINLSVI